MTDAAPSRFEILCRPFAQGLLDKTRALHTLDLNKHQQARLKEAIGIDVRKLVDILVPDARQPEVSVVAAEQAERLGVDLRQQTWHTQPRFDSGRQVFHYEHMNPVVHITAAIPGVESPEALVALMRAQVRLAWITKEEDARLTALGFRSKRPDPDAAYRAAGIVLLTAAGEG